MKNDYFMLIKFAFQGKKFELQESWGEQLDVKRPVLGIVDISSGIATVLDQIPPGISPAFVSFSQRNFPSP